MVTLRTRRVHSPPSMETVGESPSLLPASSDEEAEDCRRQQETIQTALRVPPGTKLSKIIDGEHWPPIFVPENVRSAKAMKPRPNDIFICTYPKCGTTWIQHIVHQLLGKVEYEATVDEQKPSCSREEEKKKTAMCFTSPMIERMGADYCDTIKTPRVLKSHFTYENIPKGGNAKYIYAVRNPKDCLNSYFHHNRNFKLYNFEHGEFSVFFSLFMRGEVGFGDYFKHLTSWMDGIERNEEQILFLKYEDMVADLRSAVIKIATFLGGKGAEVLEDEAKLEKIVNASTLKAMKRNPERWFPSEQLNGEEFIRKGGSRDWENLFSFEQSKQMDKRIREQLQGYDAATWWKQEMEWNDEPSQPSPPASLDASSEVSSFASSATSGFYSASPNSFPSFSSLDISSPISRLRQPSLNPEGDLAYSPIVEGPLDRHRLDSLPFGFHFDESKEE